MKEELINIQKVNNLVKIFKNDYIVKVNNKTKFKDYFLFND